jgi:hypothetical protein
VKVIVHRLTDGRTMVAILRSQWRGMVRLDMRYTSARPLSWDRPAPAGVDEDVWSAYCGLGDLVAEQHARMLGESL